MFRVAAVVAALLACGGCKKHRPPPLADVWMGAEQTCALAKSGEAYCWGASEEGRPGGKASGDVLFPASAPALEGASAVAFGDRHACALASSRVSCWGQGPAATAPPLTGVTALAAAGTRTCAIEPEGVTCWGEGSPLALRGVAKAVAVGRDHVCAAFEQPSREIRCSGADEYGQTGAGSPLLGGVPIVSLAAGANFTCAVAEGGVVHCWGRNDRGQLGDGTRRDAREPVVVHGLDHALQIACGGQHACARSRAKTVACWGGNEFHQLASGSTAPSATPLPLFGMLGVSAIAAGGEGTCARLDDGSVRCWGRNDRGQLGDGTTREHAVPMPLKWPAPR